MKKRGFIATQFNLIYVVIVGVALLVVFISIYSGMRRSSKEALNQDVKETLAIILNTAEVNVNAENSVLIADVELDFDCNNYFIEDSATGTYPIEFNSVFSPDKLKNEILTYSLYWEMPFKTQFMSYLTSSDIAYVVVDNSDIAGPLFSLIPENVNKFLVSDVSDFKNNNYYKVRVITFDNLNIQNLNLKDAEVSVLKVELIEEKENFPESYGKITYYDKSLDSEDEIYFMDKATLLAGIYSETGEVYTCNMEKAFKKANSVLKVIKDKTEELSSVNNLNNCPYQDSVSILDNLIQTTSDEVNQNTIEKIHKDSKELDEENRLLKKLSCPLIY